MITLERWNLLLLTCVLAASPGWSQEPQPSAVRTWKDDTGMFTIEATFVSSAGGQVTLRRTDGRTLTIPLTKLCVADRKVVATLTKPPAPPPMKATTEEPSSTEMPTAPLPPPKHGPPEFELTAEKLFAEFKPNPKAAGDKYDKKILQVTGEVQAVNRDGIKPVVIRFLLKGGSGGADIVHCQVAGEECLELAGPGQTITLRGVGHKVALDIPYILQCDIIKVTGPAPARFTTKELAARATKDPLKFKKEFENKHFFVTGTVGSIQTEGGEGIVVQEGKTKFFFKLAVTEGYGGPASTLMAGGAFRVLGNYNHFASEPPTSVQFYNCLVLPPKP
jgi:hypothetical protein